MVVLACVEIGLVSSVVSVVRSLVLSMASGFVRLIFGGMRPITPWVCALGDTSVSVRMRRVVRGWGSR